MTTLGAARPLAASTTGDRAPHPARVDSESGEASQRVLRLLYLSVAIGGIIYAGVGLGKAFSQFDSLVPWFAWASWTASTAFPIALGILALWAPIRVLRIVASVYGILFLVIMLAWRLFAVTGGLPHDDSPWTNDVMTVAAIAVAVSWPTRAVWAYVIVSAMCSGIVRFDSDPEVGWKLAMLDTSYNLLMNCVFASLTLVSRSGAARLDQAAAAARLETSREAEASARVQQRVRIDALVHDHVLSALLVASRDEGVSRDALRTLAASTLETLRDESVLPLEPLSQEDFVGRLRSSITSQSDGIGFEAVLGGQLRIPPEIAQGLLEATAEAVRNTLRHAKPVGRGSAGEDAQGGDAVVSRLVRIRADDVGLTIRVSDDGRGFNSRRIPPERLGVRVSILTRMTTLPGGTASIESGRDSGTTVTIGWAAPPASAGPAL